MGARREIGLKRPFQRKGDSTPCEGPRVVPRERRMTHNAAAFTSNRPAQLPRPRVAVGPRRAPEEIDTKVRDVKLPRDVERPQGAERRRGCGTTAHRSVDFRRAPAGCRDRSQDHQGPGGRPRGRRRGPCAPARRATQITGRALPGAPIRPTATDQAQGPRRAAAGALRECAVGRFLSPTDRVKPKQAHTNTTHGAHRHDQHPGRFAGVRPQ